MKSVCKCEVHSIGLEGLGAQTESHGSQPLPHVLCVFENVALGHSVLT